jgi:hypothetical protein
MSFSSLITDILRQLGKRLTKSLCGMRFHRESISSSLDLPIQGSDKASSAKWANTSSEFSKDSDHRFSEAISSRIQFASASCSADGSLEASGKAASSFVMRNILL